MIESIEWLLVINIIMLVITIIYDAGRLYYERCKVKKMDENPLAVAMKKVKEEKDK